MSINLTKGQQVSLTKESGALTRVRMGLGWDPVTAKKGLFRKAQPAAAVDLDASVVLLDGAGEVVDTVWFRQLRSKDGSIEHTGDNLTGDGDGDDESIKVNLPAVPAQVQTLVFTVTSFSQQGFGDVANAFCRVIDESAGSEFARYDLSAQGSHQAMVIAKVARDGGAWQMQALGSTGAGRTVMEMLPLVKKAAAPLA